MRESTAVVASKWVGLAAAIWVQASAGNAYMFAFYSPSLKAVLHYNQLQLNNLGVAKDFGENVGLVAGLLCNRVPAWVLLCTGALFGCVGYGTLWLVVSEQIAPLPYWQMLVLQCIGSNSATWFNTAVLVTCMRNFPHSRGTVVGILKGFVGLSAAIFAQVYTALLAGNAALLLLFLASVPTAVCLASMLLVRPVLPVVRDPEERQNFNYITGVCVALAGYLLAITFTEKLVEMRELIPVVLTAVMVVFLAAPLAIPVKALSLEYCCSGIQEPLLGEEKVSAHDQIQEPLLSDDHSQTSIQEKYSAQHMIQEPLLSNESSIHEKLSAHEQVQEPLLGDDSQLRIQEKNSAQDVIQEPLLSDDSQTSNIREKSAQGSTKMGRKKVTLHEDVAARLMNQEEDDAETLLAVGEGAVKRPKRRPRRGEDFKLRQALVKADFWLLFLTFFCGVGTGVTVINNLGQIGEAQGYYNVNIFVSLISIANFLGRLGGGSLSEHYIRSDAIPRTLWMGVAQTLLTVVHLMLASAIPGTLYLGSILLGLCYGVHFSIMVPTASELFGLKHFGMIYNSLTIANPLGSFLFSGLIAGYLYDKEAAKGAGHGAVCTGAHCFRLTFYVMACVCGVGVVLTCVLTYRIRRVYVALYRKSPHPSASDLQALE